MDSASNNTENVRLQQVLIQMYINFWFLLIFLTFIIHVFTQFLESVPTSLSLRTREINQNNVFLEHTLPM